MISDNASTDATGDICREFAAADGRVFVGDRIRIPNALHAQLMVQMGAQTPETTARLLAFYEQLNETRDPNEVIPNVFKWVQARFEQAFKPVTPSVTPDPADDAYLRALDRATTRHADRLTQE